MAKAEQDIYIDRPDGHAVGSARVLVARSGQEIPPRFAGHPAVKAATPAAPASPLEANPDDAGAYDGLTVAELRALCDDRDIDVASDARKADLLAALEAADDA